MTERALRPKNANEYRLRRLRQDGMQHGSPGEETFRPNALIDCGWGRLIFAHTFDSPAAIASALRAEGPDRRDIAYYVRDPHVVLANAPQELFLDPSHSYRLQLATYRPAQRRRSTFSIRRLTTFEDAEAVNAIYLARGMVPVPPEFFWSRRDARTMTVYVAEDSETGRILGSAMGLDHHLCFDDPERGSSLWCLAVAPDAPHPGIGESLVRRLAEHFKWRGASFMDLSVMHDNEQAIALYEKLGFRRVPVFALKRKNPFNEPLFMGSGPEADLNPYARIIVDEARRRGIQVELIDAEGGFFRLVHGGRSVRCRESLSDLTSAVSLALCDDKRVTRRVVQDAGVRVPERLLSLDDDSIRAFLREHGAVVVKPSRGEQGAGVSAGLTSLEEVRVAMQVARRICPDVLVEAFFEGEDLRLVVIDYEVVAAAVRRPAEVVGDGRATIRELIEAQSRRRSAATGGESLIPIDEETERCVAAAGFGLDSVPAQGVTFPVRKAANLHTGGTIHDVTADLHPDLREAAIRAARSLEIPVTGIDFMVRNPSEPDYVFIEANERPGLANHQPQPTAERFVDLLFPATVLAPAGEQMHGNGG